MMQPTHAELQRRIDELQALVHRYEQALKSIAVRAINRRQAVLMARKAIRETGQGAGVKSAQEGR